MDFQTPIEVCEYMAEFLPEKVFTILEPTGIYSSRVKPKIKELLDTWFPKKKKLIKMIGDGK